MGGGGFFFQAEDGIRGTSVTGVQTCALPILRSHGYYPPVLAEHNADGTILGIVRDLRLDEDRGRIVADLEFRSEERRVGRECRYRWSPNH